MQTLKLGARGSEVERLQLAINQRSIPRGFGLIAVDGDLGPQTLKAVQRVGRALGALETTLKQAREDSEVSIGLQRMIRYPEARDAKQLRRARERGDRIVTNESTGGTLRDRAVDEAQRLVGVMEVGGNNRGKAVERIIASGGGRAGDAWCGWFVAHCYRVAGSKAIDWRWGAVRLLPLVGGLRRTSSPKRGDLVRFTFDHVGLFLKDNGNGTILTCEGNTGRTGAVSDGRTGGDGVYIKVRPKSLVRDYLEVVR